MTVENISIAVKSTGAETAAKHINSLVGALTDLEKATSTMIGLQNLAALGSAVATLSNSRVSSTIFNSMSKGIENLSAALKTLTPEDIANLTSLTSALVSLNNVNLGGLGGASSVSKAASSFGQTAQGIKNVGSAAKESTKHTNAFASSLMRIAKYRLLRTVIKEITQAFNEGLKNAYHFSKGIDGSLAASLDTLATKSLTMKNQMGAAFGALLQAVMPIILQIISLVTRLMQALSALFSAIGGGQYLIAKDTATAWDKATGAAKKYKNTILGFDEINRLDDENGGGGGSGSNWADMFTEGKLPKWAQFIKDHLEEIKTLAEAIGLAIAAWKIASVLGNLAGAALSMSKLAGIAMSVAGAFMLVKGAIDAFTNGTTWENVNNMLNGTMLLAGGLYLAFGSLGAAIGLVVGGVTMIAAALNDFIKKGKLTSESLYALEGGLLAVGAGIALLTGSWIPLAIAGLTGLLIAIGVHAEEINTAVDEFFGNLISKIDEFLKQIENNTGLDLTALRRTVMYTLNYIRFDIEATVARIGWIVEDLGRIVKAVAENDWNGAWTAMQQLTNDASIDVSKDVAEMAKSVTDDMMNGKTATENLSGAFTDLLNNVRSKAPSAKSEYDSFATAVQNDTNNTLTPLQNFWDKLTGILSTLQQIAGISTTGGGLLGLLSGNGWNFSLGSIFGYASGGFPDVGEVFISREAGPELVGTINGHSAVANNDQIVEAVASGVYEAVSSAMSNTNERPMQVRVYLDSREIRVGQNRLVRAMGV